MSKKKCTDGRRNNKPPKEHQFKKGQSGNSKGRTKGSKSVKTAFSEELLSMIPITENGKSKDITKLQAIIKKLINTPLQKEDVLTMFKILSLAKEYLPEESLEDEENQEIDISSLTMEEKKLFHELLIKTLSDPKSRYR